MQRLSSMDNHYQIQEVTTKQTHKEFIKLPQTIYKNDHKWVHPLNSDMENIFSPQKNRFFQHGKLCRWLLKKGDGETIGRVAAFVDNNTSNLTEQPTGGIGFFECINDKKAAFQLFDQCKKWLQDQGMEAMDGPINFGERHQWWGLLIDGFHRPNYAMPYNPPYYSTLFEQYGFQTYFKQYTYRTTFDSKNMNKVLIWKANRIFANPDYRIKHFTNNNSKIFIKDFVTIYNEAWAKVIPGVEGISKEQAEDLFLSLKPILVEKLMWFAYHKDQPIGFFIMIPDMNQILKHLKGEINWLGKLLLLYHKHFKKNRNALGLIFGVTPKFQSKGIESAMIKKFSDEGIHYSFPFKTLEMNWIGDFNPRMMHLMEYIGAKIHKTHITYRILFDKTRPFKKATVIK